MDYHCVSTWPVTITNTPAIIPGVPHERYFPFKARHAENGFIVECYGKEYVFTSPEKFATFIVREMTKK